MKKLALITLFVFAACGGNSSPITQDQTTRLTDRDGNGLFTSLECNNQLAEDDDKCIAVEGPEECHELFAYTEDEKLCFICKDAEGEELRRDCESSVDGFAPCDPAEEDGCFTCKEGEDPTCGEEPVRTCLDNSECEEGEDCVRAMGCVDGEGCKADTHGICEVIPE